MSLPVEQMERLPPGSTFKTLIRSRKEWEELKDLRTPVTDAATLMCYTDGSKAETGDTGSGIFIEGENGIEASIPLGIWPTVFQSEVYALLESAGILRGLNSLAPKREVNIYSDSLSSIQALTDSALQSGLVCECKKALNKLGTETKLSLIWIPAHRGHFGNEMADLLAKTASEKRFIGPEPAIPVSVHIVQESIRQWARSKHRARWRRMDECAQARQVLAEPKESNRLACCRLSRNEIQLLTQMVTGHSTLKGHLHKMGLSNDPTCDYCGQGTEDRNHFLCRCEAFCINRLEILGLAFVEPSDLLELPLRLVLEFVKKSARLEKVTQRVLIP